MGRVVGRGPAKRGLPTDMVFAVCDKALARSTDLDGQPEGGEPLYDVAYADDAKRLSRATIDIAADPGFREAIT